ncbi:MAG: TolC family protein [Pseudomonadota bacterium]|nr:TolC family protein [Pseudomonadota bacterium]
MRHLLLLSLALMALSGCASIKETPAPVMQTAEQYFARRLDDAGLKSFIEQATGKPASGTWDAQQLTLAALYFNPDLDVARSQWEVSKAGKITAGQRPNPSVSITPSHDATQPSPWFFGLDINLPIETAGKRELRVEQAEHLASVAEYQVGSAAWAVRSRVVNALIDVVAADTSVALYRQQADAQKAVLDVFSERTAQGQLPSVTASQVRVAYQQTLLAEKEAAKQAVEARARLAAAIGVSLTALDSIKIDPDGLELPSAAVVDRPSALKVHTGLMAALAEYEAAHSALQLELAKQMPDINLGPGYSWNKDGNAFRLGLSITLPVFNNNEGPIAEAVAKRKLAVDKFNAAQADIIGRIDGAEASLKTAKSKLDTADRLLAAQQDKLKQLQSQLRPAEASKLPLLLAQSEIYTAAIARQDALVQVLKSKAALEEALEQPQFGSAFDASASRQPPRPEGQ